MSKDNIPDCAYVRGCSQPARSLVRTKQIRKQPGSGVETTVTWDIEDTGEYLRKTGTPLCPLHRDELLESLARTLG